MRKCAFVGRLWGFLALAGCLFVPSTAAQALDCGKAATAVETTICAAPQLKAADDAMAAAYEELWQGYDKTERAALAGLQRRWLKKREESCARQAGADLTACILAWTEERRRFLTGAPESGPGTAGRMIPVFAFQQGDDIKNYDIAVGLLKFADPRSAGEKLFNEIVAEVAAERPEGETYDEPADNPFEYHVGMEFAYASPKFISARIGTWSQNGTGHGYYATTTTNLDLVRGVLVKAEDWFDEVALSTLKAECVAQIAAQKKADDEAYDSPNDPFYSEAIIADRLKSAGDWTFWKDKASVDFHDDLAAPVAGKYSCDFLTERIRNLAKPGAPLPDADY